jgi:hypothetical protein
MKAVSRDSSEGKESGPPVHRHRDSPCEGGHSYVGTGPSKEDQRSGNKAQNGTNAR